MVVFETLSFQEHPEKVRNSQLGVPGTVFFAVCVRSRSAKPLLIRLVQPRSHAGLRNARSYGQEVARVQR